MLTALPDGSAKGAEHEGHVNASIIGDFFARARLSGHKLK
jgi:hypothetical protein